MKNKPLLVVITLLVIVSFIAACDKQPPPTPAPIEEVVEEPAAPAEVAPEPAAEDEANVLPPDPQPVSFASLDGAATLDGLYYPAAVENAPLVVLMHWAGGDMSDWYEIAVWLQNRGQANPFPNPGDAPWWDPSWFPEVTADKSYAVLLFTFRGCVPYEAGCQTMDRAGWLDDAQSAMVFARGLEGIDPQSIAAIGSSIGADGAADACELVNETYPDTCQASLSLSPGDYLEVSYVVTMIKMGSLKKPTIAWCLADESEYGLCEAAEAAANPAVYKAFMIPGGGHGNMLLSPDLDPLPMQLILDFLEESLK